MKIKEMSKEQVKEIIHKAIENIETQTTPKSIAALGELLTHIFENPEKFFDAVGEACKSALSFCEELEKDAEKKADFLKFAGITDEEFKNTIPPTELIDLIAKYKANHGENVPAEYIKMLNCPELNQLPRVNKNKIIPQDNIGQYIGNNVKFTIENFNKNGALKTSAHKLLDTAVCLLTAQVRMNSKPEEIAPRCLCELDIDAYATMNGINLKPSGTGTPEEQEEELKKIKRRRHKFTDSIHEDLKAIESVTWISDRTRSSYRIISSHHSARNGKVIIAFDPATAYWLANNYIMQYPVGLLRHDNRNFNAFAIGRKLAEHHNINRNKKNSNTISIKALLESAPELRTFEEYAETNRRHWKTDIKDRLESALNQNTDPYIHVLKSWNYRNGDTVLTSDQAGELSPAVYSQLMIDFDLYPYDNVIEAEAEPEK